MRQGSGRVRQSVFSYPKYDRKYVEWVDQTWLISVLSRNQRSKFPMVIWHSLDVCWSRRRFFFIIEWTWEERKTFPLADLYPLLFNQSAMASKVMPCSRCSVWSHKGLIGIQSNNYQRVQGNGRWVWNWKLGQRWKTLHYTAHMLQSNEFLKIRISSPFERLFPFGLGNWIDLLC